MTRAALKTARLILRPVAAVDEGVVGAGLNDLGVTGWLSVVPLRREARGRGLSRVRGGVKG